LSTPAAAAAQPDVNGVEEAGEKRRHTTLAVSSKKVAEEEVLGEAEAIAEPPAESPAQTTEEAPEEVMEAPAEAPAKVPVGAPLEAPADMHAEVPLAAAVEIPTDVDPPAGEEASTEEAPADEPSAADGGNALAEVDGTVAPATTEETKEPLKVTIRKNFSAAKRRLSLRFRKSEAPAGSVEAAAEESTEAAATEVAEPTAAESPDPTAADAPLTADATVALRTELAPEAAGEQTTGASVEAAAVAEPVDAAVFAAAFEEAPTHPPPPIPESPSNEEGVEIALPVASTEEVAATSVVLDETAAPREKEVVIESAEAAADVEISTAPEELESVEGKLLDTMIVDQPIEDAMIVDESVEDPEASEKKKSLPPALAIKIDLRKSFKSAKKSISKSMGKKQGAKPEVDAEVGDASDAEGVSRKSVDIGTPLDGASSVEQSSAEDAEDTDDALDVGEKSASVPGTPSKKKINVRKSLRKVKKNLSKSLRKSKASAAEEETAAGEEPAVPSLPGEAEVRVSGEVSMEASTEEILVEPVVEGQTEGAGKEVQASSQEAALPEEEAAPEEQQVAVEAPATKKKSKHYSAKMPQFGQCFGKDRASSDTEGDADSATVMVVDNSPEAHLDLTHQTAHETEIDRSIEDVEITTIEEVEIVGSAVLADASSDEHAALASHEEISVALDMKEHEAKSTPELFVSDCTPVIIIDASQACDLDKTSVTTPLDETLPELKLDQGIRKSELETEGETPLYDHVTVLRKKDLSAKSRESLVLYYESSTITHEESEALVIEHSTEQHSTEPDISPAINKPAEIQSVEEHEQTQEVENAEEIEATAQLVLAYADPEETADAKVIDEPTQVGLVVTTVLVPTAVVVDVGETKAEMSKPEEQNGVVNEETVKAEDKPLGDCESKEAVIASEIIAILEPAAEVSSADTVVANPDQIVEEDIKDEVEEAELSSPRETEGTIVAETAVESATAVCSDEILISAQPEVIVAKEDEEAASGGSEKPENIPKTRVAEEPARAVSIDEAVLGDPIDPKKREEITEAPTSLHIEDSIYTDHSDAEGCAKETEIIAETAPVVEIDSEIIKEEDCRVENPDDQKTVKDDVKDTASDNTIIEESKLEVLIIGPSKGINAAESKTDMIKTTTVTTEVNGYVESTITLEKHEDLVTVNDLPHESIMDADTIFQSKTMIFLENRS